MSNPSTADEELREQVLEIIKNETLYKPELEGAEAYHYIKHCQADNLMAIIAESNRLARLDELDNILVDFDERKLRHIEGSKLITLDERITQLQSQVVEK